MLNCKSEEIWPQLCINILYLISTIVRKNPVECGYFKIFIGYEKKDINVSKRKLQVVISNVRFSGKEF